MVSWLDTLANVGFVFGQGLALAFIFCMVERGSFQESKNLFRHSNKIDLRRFFTCLPNQNSLIKETL